MSVGSGVAPRRAEVMQVLAAHRDELARMGVASLALFGSVARDEARPDSDVDLLVAFDPSRSVGLFEFLDVQHHLERVLGAKVDLVSRDSIKRQIRDRILGEQLPVLVATPDGDLRVVLHDEADLRAADERRREVPMPPRNWTMRIEDMLVAAAAIEQYTAGLDFEGFQADRLRIDATLRNIEIIGEAARYIPDEVRARYPAVPWQQMTDMRNLVIHAYPDVDLTKVWNVVRHQLLPLVPVLREILARESTS